MNVVCRGKDLMGGGRGPGTCESKCRKSNKCQAYFNIIQENYKGVTCKLCKIGYETKRKGKVQQYSEFWQKEC